MLPRFLKLHPRRSVLLLGPRQAGKSTLVRQGLPARSWIVDLLSHEDRLAYSKDPGRFRREAEAFRARGGRTIFVDEVQKVPELLDEVQALIDRGGLRFILTGSSARKLRRGAANLLAGRVALRRLHPLTWREQAGYFDLERTLKYGSLPAVVTGSVPAAKDLLRAYGEVYLREEVQAEALVRNLGGFGRFLDVVAASSGDIVNFSAIGRDAGIATRTVREYYQILEDTLLGFRLEAWRKSPRARMVAHPRFHLFDTGVTNALARRLGSHVDHVLRGRLFEQFFVLECVRLADLLDPDVRLHYWRTHLGAEVDLLVERHDRILAAIELKSGQVIDGADLSGLRSFGEAHPDVPRYLACSVKRESQLHGVRIAPWQEVLDVLERLLRSRS